MQNNVLIEFVKIPVSDALSKYINKKLNVLFNKYAMLIKVQVYIKKEMKSIAHNCICEIELSLRGPRLFASAKEHKYELAVKKTISELEHQLKKAKQKMLVTH
ncbi:HPF/RaiA family ribosome-associated protein [Winogradskyella jejuensis]|uniref:Putative sigma-54 modulation protein n=1 Tax=Winogradskyella jejuensis TaxID=1089305 RepID=A0A1M5KPK3_9FLAO|nr:HPF/RaiA family ribosome-associated protein [Winogradskyella jejuensis]SHG54688.1 putative sigma-54 modulation protein [Winogradskyella jejuensis]